ncbi:MAG: tetratricopeptide repeat protein, partial [Gammaproteobacteria bacterium]|nr:tetratricopeptide repeat protein [Gammaproteobacteria bacterium]
MAPPTRKFNPGFLTDDELVASYCVRTTEFELLVEALRECTGGSNPHQLVIGPRGSGKTSLLLRVAAEARRDTALSTCYFPVAFAEESYEVGTAGEFWLECLANLAAQAPRSDDAPDLDRTVEELRAIRDDEMLSDRCLGALLDFADREGKRLVLLVENLNMLFGDIADPDAGWRLRKVLQTEPRIIVFASATSRFDEIDNPDRALHDLFRVRTLRPLDTKQCSVLWETVSGRPPARAAVRSLEILTGGSPRLISIVASFGAGLSFRDLMAHLLDLVDDHTEYFKGHLESLPPQERRVYLALAALWKPATTREIANQARLETSTCSSQLARLGGRGVVRVAGGRARRKQYYLTERLYNIYYLLRRRRGPDRFVDGLIRFMEACYSPPELKDISARMARDVAGLGAEMRSLHRIVLKGLMESPSLVAYRDELLEMVPAGFVAVAGWATPPAEVAQTTAEVAAEVARSASSQSTDEPAEKAARELFQNALNVRNGAEDTVAAYEKIIRRFGESESPAVLEWVAKALVNKGAALSALNRPQDALRAYDEVVRRFGESDMPPLLESVAKVLVNRGIACDALNQPEEALASYDEVIRRFGKSEVPALLEQVAKTLVNKGAALGTLNRSEDALELYDEVIRRFGESDSVELLEAVSNALVNRGATLGTLNRPQHVLETCDEVVRRFGESETPAFLKSVGTALMNKGAALVALNRPQDALEVCDEVVRRFGKSDSPALLEPVARALVNRGGALGALNRWQEVLEACDEVVRRFGKSDSPALLEPVARALVNRGGALGALNRWQEVLEACDEVVRRFGKSDSPALLE